MRKAIIVGVVVAVVAGVAVLAFGQSHRKFGRQFGFRGADPALFLRQLDLTDDQKAQVKEILTSTRTTVQPIVEEMKNNREKLNQSTGKGFDEAQVTTVAKRQGELMSQLIVERERTRSKVFALLTDDQKTKANVIREKMQERTKSWSARRKGGEGQPSGF